MAEETGCSSYLDGHNTHYIPVLKLAPQREAIAGTAWVDFHRGEVFFEPDGEGDRVGPLFNHNLPLVAAALAAALGEARWIPSLRLLSVAVPQGRGMYSMSLEPLGECPPWRPPDQELAD
jgi:hypothetical protein